MATGDQGDMLARLRGALPPWFGDGGPILSALLRGLAEAAAALYGMANQVRMQMRIATATDDNLDIIASDFFGDGLVRATGQSDASFRNVIRANLLRPRATRPALVAVVGQLTGRTPVVLEPKRPVDFGGYGLAQGYGSGAYGFSMPLPYQAFVTAYRARDQNGAVGYGTVQGGYGEALVYGASNMQADADIATAVNGVRPIGSEVWLRVTS